MAQIMNFVLPKKSEVSQSCQTLCDLWTVAHKAPSSMGFSRQEYWSGFPLPSPIITKFRLKLKKVGKTTRPFRYDLNQILYDYIVKVRNRFKALDLIDRVHVELWTEVHDIVQKTGKRPSPWKRNAKKQNGCLGRPYK